MNKDSSRKIKPRCELQTNLGKRIAVNKLAASVKDTLPPGLAQPALRALAGAGYMRLDQFTRLSETDLLKLHGIGPKAIEIIRLALKKQGRTFKE